MLPRSAEDILQNNSLAPDKAVKAVDPTDTTPNVFSKMGTFNTYFKVLFTGTVKYIEPKFLVNVYDLKVYAVASIGIGTVVLIEKLEADGVTLTTIGRFVALGGAGEIVPLNPNTITPTSIDPTTGEAIKITNTGGGMVGECNVRIHFEKS